MARRKINLQDTGRKSSEQDIAHLVRDMNTSDLGFSPTDQIVYEVDLNRIRPDFSQSRQVMPFDLREKLIAQQITPTMAMAELLKRAEQGNQLALLILGGRGQQKLDDDAQDEDTGLLALANSIRRVGLRQPINLYSVANVENPGEPFYQVGEGERRFWAHQVLVTQGEGQFERIRATIEPLPDDQIIIQHRQEAENAARQDLSAIARARSIKRIRNRLSLTLGTRVPGQTTIKLPSQRELDEAVGQEVKTFTGRAISGRMVRNYLRLLTLSPGLQDLVEAAQLSEKQLRAVMRLKTDAEQLQLIKKIINEKLSGQDVLDRVKLATPTTSLKRTIPTTLEQRLEKRLFQTAKTVHEVLSLGEDAYGDLLSLLATRMADQTTQTALAALKRMIDDLVGDTQITPGVQQVALETIAPPIDVFLANLPITYQREISENLNDSQTILRQLIDWQNGDDLVASIVKKFFERLENQARIVQTQEAIIPPLVRLLEESHQWQYELVTGKITYWTYAWLYLQGYSKFEEITVEVSD